MQKEANAPVETIIDLLGKQNIKEVERATGIPADRMYKWIKGKGTPKAMDMAKLMSFLKLDLDSMDLLSLVEFEHWDPKMFRDLAITLEKTIGFLEMSVKYKDKTIAVLEERIEELKERIEELKKQIDNKGSE